MSCEGWVPKEGRRAGLPIQGHASSPKGLTHRSWRRHCGHPRFRQWWTSNNGCREKFTTFRVLYSKHVPLSVKHTRGIASKFLDTNNMRDRQTHSQYYWDGFPSWWMPPTRKSQLKPHSVSSSPFPTNIKYLPGKGPKMPCGTTMGGCINSKRNTWSFSSHILPLVTTLHPSLPQRECL